MNSNVSEASNTGGEVEDGTYAHALATLVVLYIIVSVIGIIGKNVLSISMYS